MVASSRSVSIAILLVGAIAYSASAASQCSSNERTAVFLVSGIYPGTNLQLETLTVTPVGEITNPSDDDIIAAIMQIQPGDYYNRSEEVNSFYQYVDPAGDVGGVALVDRRDGAILFAGTVVWMGLGEVTIPAESSHSWSLSPGTPGPAPASIALMSNPDWPNYPTPDQVTASVLIHLRQTDVFQSFGACGPFSVVSYIYTPAVGATIPEYGKCILIVSGRCGPPWSGGTVAEESLSWGAVKGLYR